MPLCILEDQHQFVLGFNIIGPGVNTEPIEPLVDHVMENVPTLDTLSTDKGFWSPVSVCLPVFETGSCGDPEEEAS